MRTYFWVAILLPAVLAAQQAPRSGPALWEGAWWNSPIVQDLELNDPQRKEIRGTVREYRGHLMDLREAVQRADNDLEIALGENPPDQRKANDAIERLATTRGELTRTLSRMTLRLRTILSNEQWQELQKRQAERRRASAGEEVGKRPNSPPASSPQP